MLGQKKTENNVHGSGVNLAGRGGGEGQRDNVPP